MKLKINNKAILKLFKANIDEYHKLSSMSKTYSEQFKYLFYLNSQMNYLSNPFWLKPNHTFIQSSYKIKFRNSTGNSREQKY